MSKPQSNETKPRTWLEFDEDSSQREDEQLPETPPEIIDLLGYDPLEE